MKTAREHIEKAQVELAAALQHTINGDAELAEAMRALARSQRLIIKAISRLREMRGKQQ